MKLPLGQLRWCSMKTEFPNPPMIPERPLGFLKGYGRHGALPDMISQEADFSDLASFRPIKMRFNENKFPLYPGFRNILLAFLKDMEEMGHFLIRQEADFSDVASFRPIYIIFNENKIQLCKDLIGVLSPQPGLGKTRQLAVNGVCQGGGKAPIMVSEANQPSAGASKIVAQRQ